MRKESQGDTGKITTEEHSGETASRSAALRKTGMLAGLKEQDILGPRPAAAAL